MVYERNYTADYSLCDYSGNLSIEAVAQIVESSVAANFGLMGCDNLTLRTKYDAMWVFVKNYIHVGTLPKWNDAFRVECYCISFKKLKCTVETDFIDEKGEVFAYSVLECCVLDCSSHALRKLDTIPFPMDYQVREGREYAFTGKLAGEFQELEKVSVRTTDLDYSRHVNNVSYIRYILNTFTVEELLKMKIHTIEIYYIRETQEGAVLSVTSHEESCFKAFTIKNGDTEVFSIHLKYEE